MNIGYLARSVKNYNRRNNMMKQLIILVLVRITANEAGLVYGLPHEL